MRLALVLALLASTASAQVDPTRGASGAVRPSFTVGAGGAADPAGGWGLLQTSAALQAGAPTARARAVLLAPVLGADSRWEAAALVGATVETRRFRAFAGGGPGLTGGRDGTCGLLNIGAVPCQRGSRALRPLVGAALAAEGYVRLGHGVAFGAQALANLNGSRSIRGLTLGVQVDA